MIDDFLEDIGIDSRNLGQPPGQGFGTAFGTLNSSQTGGNDIGFNDLGDPTNQQLIMGQNRTAGRIQHILDGFVGAAQGSRLNSALRGLTMQVTWLDDYSGVYICAESLLLGVIAGPRCSRCCSPYTLWLSMRDGTGNCLSEQVLPRS